MQENNTERNVDKKQSSDEKIQNTVFSVQSLKLESDAIFEIDYTGGMVYLTKEMFSRMKNQAEKSIEKDSIIKDLNDEIQSKKADIAKIKGVGKTWVDKCRVNEKLVVDLNKKIEELESALTAEKASNMAIASKLAKFTDHHKNMPSKKAIFTPEEKTQIANMMQTQMRQEGKISVKAIHEYIQAAGRRNGNVKHAAVSYETVRAAVAELKHGKSQ